ncbi:hypothetical protein GXW82_28850 [Streptacidiphilus sp. 4-A2]|nr:hypothetical protein [Streptacidiphilus sp. 4-A2]
MRFNLLGPVTVTIEGEPVPLQPGIPRDLLVVLLLNANRALSGEQLAAAVWGNERPAAFAAGLRNHISRLRRQLGPQAGARIRTVAPGYLAEIGENELDERLFLDGCRRGLQTLQAGDFAAAADGLAGRWSCGAASPSPTSCPPSTYRPRRSTSRRPGCWRWRVGSRRICGWGGTANWCRRSARWPARTRCGRRCTGS